MYDIKTADRSTVQTHRAFFIPNLSRNDVKLAQPSGRDPCYQSVGAEGDHMKREDITALLPDITEEQLDKIMGLHGADGLHTGS